MKEENPLLHHLTLGLWRAYLMESECPASFGPGFGPLSHKSRPMAAPPALTNLIFLVWAPFPGWMPSQVLPSHAKMPQDSKGR